MTSLPSKSKPPTTPGTGYGNIGLLFSQKFLCLVRKVQDPESATLAHQGSFLGLHFSSSYKVRSFSTILIYVATDTNPPTSTLP